MYKPFHFPIEPFEYDFEEELIDSQKEFGSALNKFGQQRRGAINNKGVVDKCNCSCQSASPPDILPRQKRSRSLALPTSFRPTGMHSEFETVNTDLQFIDPRIAVSAQRALITMSRSVDPVEKEEAFSILASVKNGRLQGLYEQNMQKPALLAKRNGLDGYWQLLPPSQNSGLLCEGLFPASAPMFVYRVGLAKPVIITEIRNALSPWLLEIANPMFCANAINPQSVDVCQLTLAHPVDVTPSNSLKPIYSQQSALSESATMQNAFRASRQSLRLARSALTNLLSGFTLERQGHSLTPFQQRVLASVGKWLKADVRKNSSARTQTTDIVTRAIKLIEGNLAVKTSTGQDPTFSKVDSDFFAEVNGNPDSGVRCGKAFFLKVGLNCQRDVITHEFFHFVGVKHGGSPNNGPTIRSIITTPDLALDSADNLAQLVSEIRNGRTDACTRIND